MAVGEMVQLLRRIYLSADKSAAVPMDDPGAAWFLGGEGHQMPKAECERLGLVEGEDFGPITSAMEIVLEQERARRAQHAETNAVMIEPPPHSTATTPDRLAYHRESGEPISGNPALLSSASVSGAEEDAEEESEEAAKTSSASQTRDRTTPDTRGDRY
jgi:hypothetical protein